MYVDVDTHAGVAPTAELCVGGRCLWRQSSAARIHMVVLDVYKEGEVVETLELSASKRIYKVGRQAGVADIVLAHGSISREQATLTVSASGTVVVCDLGSAHGTLISGKRLPPHKPHTLPPGRSLTFGQSSRIFKLREGASGFVTAAAAVPLAAGGSATGAASLDDPRVQACLSVLRHGAADCADRLRPDGYLRLSSLLDTAAVQRAGWRESVELASMAGKLPDVFESCEEEGELLLRARDGHAASVRVDTALRLCPASDLLTLSGGVQTLVCGTTFKCWNAVRSQGAGAGAVPPTPIRLSTIPPPAGAKLPSLQRAADLHVYLNVQSLRQARIPLFRVLGGGGGEGGEGGEGGMGGVRGEGSAASAEGLDGAGDGGALESLVCVGDAEGGALGPWHFACVRNARDGSEMMGGEEVAALRAARSERAAQQEAAAKAKADVDEARRLQREATRKRAEFEATACEAAPPPKVARANPYLAHLAGRDDDEDDE